MLDASKTEGKHHLNFDVIDDELEEYFRNVPEEAINKKLIQRYFLLSDSSSILHRPIYIFLFCLCLFICRLPVLHAQITVSANNLQD